MASIYKSKVSANWIAKFYGPDGKRHTRSTGTDKKRDAERIAAEYEANARKGHDKSVTQKALQVVLEIAARDAEQGALTLARAEQLLERMKRIANPDYTPRTLPSVWSDWIAEQKPHVSPNTLQSYYDDAKMILASFPKTALNRPISEITPAMVHQALTKAKGEGRKGSTINRARGCLRRCLDWAITNGWLHANPAKEIRPFSQADSDERGPFSQDEVKRLIAAAESPEWAAFILLAAHTGIRSSDVAGLSDANIDGERIVVRPAKTSRLKKIVSVPMSDDVKAWVTGKTGAFFPVISRLDARQRANKFNLTMARAGVPKEATGPGGITLKRSFHSLRHTFTSWLADADVASDVRQKLTGHSSAGIHQRYTHHDAALSRAIEKLPSLSGE